MKYWAYVNNEILGPYEKEKLLELPTFSPSLLVCPQTPVGEKTEDWKEAATYPELSALIASGGASAPKPAAAPPPAASPAAAPSAAPAPAAFKPLTASAIDPVAPIDHKFGGVEIQSGKLGRASDSPLNSPAPAPAPEAAAPASNAASFDPLTLSQVVRRSEPAASENQPAPAQSPDLESFGPPKGQPAPAMSPEIENFSRSAAFQPQAAAPAPVPEQSPAPASAAPAAAASVADGGALLAKLAALEKNVVSRQDMASMVDPLRMKLDQMGEVISSMKNQQSQREIMDKLARLESAIAELKSGGTPAYSAAPAVSPAPASIAPAEVKDSGRTVFGVGPKAAPEAPKAEPAAPQKIEDTGSNRSSKLAGLFKKLFKFLVTLLLLGAVLLGGVIFLKKFNIFDATAFVPFPLPFIGAEAPAQPAEQPAAEGQLPPELAQAAKDQAAQSAQAPAQAQPRDLSPEIVYFTRTYKPSPSGPSLEDKLADMAMAEGADYAKVDWKVKLGTENIYEISAVMPIKGGSVTYTFVADYAKKTLMPGDARGTAVLDALLGKPYPSKTVKPAKGQPQGRRKAPQVKRQAAAAKRAAPAAKKAAPAEDEYEYVYEDEDGTGQ